MKNLIWSMILVSLVSCTRDTEPEITPISVNNIQQVLMHDNRHFTFLIEHPSGTIGRLIIRVRFDTNNKVNLRLLRDIKENESIRIEYTCGGGGAYDGQMQCKAIPNNFSEWGVEASSLTIHLHSAKEINGAGWDHGKHGRGQTVVIE